MLGDGAGTICRYVEGKICTIPNYCHKQGCIEVWTAEQKEKKLVDITSLSDYKN